MAEKQKIQAAGTIFIAKDTKRILLNFRSQTVSKPGTFGFWGGKIENGEKILGGLSRELIEEVGFIPTHEKIAVLDQYVSHDNHFTYTSFIIVTPTEFIPKINHESCGYIWCDLENYPKPLHPGARIILENKSTVNAILKMVGSLS